MHFFQSIQGQVFERWVEKQLFQGANVTVFPLGQVDDEFTLKFKPFKHHVLFTLNKIPPNRTAVPYLYVPAVPNFPGWDFISDQPGVNGSRCIIFIQVSVESIRQHQRLKKTGETKITGTFVKKRTLFNLKRFLS